MDHEHASYHGMSGVLSQRRDIEGHPSTACILNYDDNDIPCPNLQGFFGYKSELFAGLLFNSFSSVPIASDSSELSLVKHPLANTSPAST